MLRNLALAVIVTYVAAAGAWVVSEGFGRQEFLNVACDPTRELWRDVNAEFVKDYEKSHGVKLHIRQSHGGSGSQARAVIDGLDADVVSLALWTDTDAIRKAGLIEPGWERQIEEGSLPYHSTIVLVVRKGNPKRITTWADLARVDVSVVTPNPKTSGNGKWSFLAIWGSVVWAGGTDEQARDLVKRVYRRVPVLDAAARGATMTFAQKGIGDVHLTWENEAHLEVKEAGGALEIVYPPISVLAEPHVAIVDRNVDRKDTRAAATAYLKFLFTEPAQQLIAKHYHRPANAAVLERHRDLFPKLDLRRATTLVPSGKWDDVQKRFFAEGGVFDQVYAEGRK
jgi:sulfate transport system substrate-binding protein